MEIFEFFYVNPRARVLARCNYSLQARHMYPLPIARMPRKPRSTKEIFNMLHIPLPKANAVMDLTK